MRKILLIFTIALLFFTYTQNISYCAINKQINANIKTKSVPAGTVITLRVLDPIGSGSSLAGDEFDLSVTENIKVEDTLVIPKGSIIRGSVETVETPKCFYKGGVIRLYFDHIVSSTGKQVSVYAGIYNNKNVTYDGALSSKTTYSDALNQTAKTTKDIVVKSTSWSWEKGDDMLNGYPKYVLAPITAIVTTPVAGVYFIGGTIVDMFKKGKNITVNQGDILQVQLLSPLDMPVY